MRHPPLLLLALVLAAPLAAHPDHTVTQKGVIPLVPATEPAPGRSEVSITLEGDRRVITSNGIPDHAVGRFPNSGNPHRIVAQRYRYSVPAKPVANERITPLNHSPFGIAVNGVVFDPATAESWQNDRESGWSYDAKGGAFSLGLDASNAHVQPDGAYHYHGIPTALLARLSGGQPRMTLLGWAADGFPIYGVWGYRKADDPKSGIVKLKTSYRLKSGTRPTANGQPGGTYDGVFVEDFTYRNGTGDLDECSGRFGVTPEFPEGTFYYVLTEDFPFIPRAWRGTPDRSFLRRGGPGGGGPGGPGGERRGPPPGGRPPPRFT